MSSPVADANVEMEDKRPNPISLAREIMDFRKTKHPYGYNYMVKLRMGHAEIHDLTAVADIVSAIGELGYTIIKRTT